MIKKFLEGIYRFSSALFKKTDKLCAYKLGIVLRNVTNINTRKYWDKYFSQFKDSWRDFPYRLVVEFLPKDVSFSLLDIGCALGDGCRLLKGSFPQARISGADFSDTAIKKCKANSPAEIKFFILDAAKDDIPESYDYIVMSHILEHFNDPFPVLDKCLKFVNKAIYVITPYTEKIENPLLYAKGEHRYLFNKDTFSGYNCEVVKITEYLPQYGYSYIVYRIKQ